MHKLCFIIYHIHKLYVAKKCRKTVAKTVADFANCIIESGLLNP